MLWLTCGALLACGQNTRKSPVAWSVDFRCREGAENAALVRLRILRGGCTGTAVLYDERVRRAEDVSAPHRVAQGRLRTEPPGKIFCPEIAWARLRAPCRTPMPR